jgi:hypothetical protein
MVKNGKMCKDKWNNLNSEYKKKYYHKSIGHHNSFGEFMDINEHDKHHLLKQYKIIKAF